MPDDQLKTLRVYKRLIDFQDEWGGALVFCCGVGAAASGVAPAASIAGAASLLVESDSYEMKKAFRRGEVDFIVTSLDEAVRALKNEVRQKRPLSVGLIADVDSTVIEMVERGLQPDVFLSEGQYSQAVWPILDRGTPALYVGLEEGRERGFERPMLILHRQRHYEYFLKVSSPTGLRDADARLLRLMPKDDVVRRRWVLRAAKYQRGASDGRWVYLSESEAGLLESEGFKLRSPEEYPPTAS